MTSIKPPVMREVRVNIPSKVCEDIENGLKARGSKNITVANVLELLFAQAEYVGLLNSIVKIATDQFAQKPKIIQFDKHLITGGGKRVR